MLVLEKLVEGEGLDVNKSIGFWNKDRAFKVCFIVSLALSTKGLLCRV